jgi:hypothetical protein
MRQRTTQFARGFGLVLVIIASGWPAAARGQNIKDPVAIQLKGQGDRGIESGDYAEALRAYSKALSIEPSPVLHYNRGRALQGLGRNAEALEEFEKFQRTASAKLAEAVPELNEMMDTVRHQVAEVTVKCEVPGATLHVLHEALPLPLRRSLRLDPSTLDLEVSATGYESWRTRVTLEGGETRVLEPQLRRKDLRGTIVITSPIAGARADVDGKTVGTVPVELNVSPGQHAIRVRHDDYETASSSVVVRTGERRSLSVSLQREPRFYERWWFWTGVGTLVTTGVVVGIAVSTEKSPATGDIPPGQITSPISRF